MIARWGPTYRAPVPALVRLRFASRQ